MYKVRFTQVSQLKMYLIDSGVAVVNVEYTPSRLCQSDQIPSLPVWSLKSTRHRHECLPADRGFRRCGPGRCGTFTEST